MVVQRTTRLQFLVAHLSFWLSVLGTERWLQTSFTAQAWTFLFVCWTTQSTAWSVFLVVRRLFWLWTTKILNAGVQPQLMHCLWSTYQQRDHNVPQKLDIHICVKWHNEHHVQGYNKLVQPDKKSCALYNYILLYRLQNLPCQVTELTVVQVGDHCKWNVLLCVIQEHRVLRCHGKYHPVWQAGKR